MIEEHESDIENWYFNIRKDQTLSKYLCEDRVLRKGDAGCLIEKLVTNDENSKTEL